MSKESENTDKFASIFSWSPIPQRKLFTDKFVSNKMLIIFIINKMWIQKFQNIANTDEDDLYPNCDVNIWLRSCEKEIIDPMQGKVTGKIVIQSIILMCYLL